MSPVLIVSLILNAGLLILLFFKSALNDILKELFHSWHQGRKHQKVLLRELHAKVEMLPNYYFMYLCGVVIGMRAATALEAEQGRAMAERNGADVGPILDFMRAHRLEFSEPIQVQIGHLLQAIQVGAAFSQPSTALINEKVEQVGLAVERLNEAIRSELQ
jgi:hypothetical protein